MKKKVYKIILLMLAGMQAVPAHAMWVQAARTGLAAASKKTLCFHAVRLSSTTAPKQSFIRSLAYKRTFGPMPFLAFQPSVEKQKPCYHFDNQDHSYKKYRNTFKWGRYCYKTLFCSLATASATYALITADAETCLANELPPTETPEASRICSSEETAKSEKTVDTESSEFEKFVQRFSPPQEIQQMLEIHKDKIIPFNFIEGPNEAPALLIKDYNIDRIINAERIRECIKQNNLTKLDVPKKYIYTFNDQWIVIAEYIHPSKPRQFTLEEVQQLATVAKETGYADWHIDNIIIDKNTGKLMLIDTETPSFLMCPTAHEASDFWLQLALAPWFDPLICLYMNFHLNLEEDALNWLVKHINEIVGSNDRSLPQLKKFDNLPIDYEQVKKEWDKKVNKK